jgi:hypothetical protein
VVGSGRTVTFTEMETPPSHSARRRVAPVPVRSPVHAGDRGHPHHGLERSMGPGPSADGSVLALGLTVSVEFGMQGVGKRKASRFSIQPIEPPSLMGLFAFGIQNIEIADAPVDESSPQAFGEMAFLPLASARLFLNRAPMAFPHNPLIAGWHEAWRKLKECPPSGLIGFFDILGRPLHVEAFAPKGDCCSGSLALVFRPKPIDSDRRFVNTYNYPCAVRPNLKLSIQQGCGGRVFSSFSRLAGLVSLPSNHEPCGDDCPRCYSFGPPKEFKPPWQVVLGAYGLFFAGFLLVFRSHKSAAIYRMVGCVYLGGFILYVGHNQHGCDEKSYRGPDFHTVTKTFHDGENLSRVAGAVKAKGRTVSHLDQGENQRRLRNSN